VENECAPLMINNRVVQEQLLRGRENSGEFISLSTWEDKLHRSLPGE